MKKEGIKITLGAHPDNGDVFVLPLLSDDIENDMIFPAYLTITDTMDETLKALILADKKTRVSK